MYVYILKGTVKSTSSPLTTQGYKESRSCGNLFETCHQNIELFTHCDQKGYWEDGGYRWPQE